MKRNPFFLLWASALALALAISISGCSVVPTSGFLRSDTEPDAIKARLDRIQVIDVDETVAARLRAQRKAKLFSDTFATTASRAHMVGLGDVVEVSIWEAPPASLFGAGTLDARGSVSGARSTTLPEQMVSADGTINVPFAGKVPAANRTLDAIEAEIVKRLTGKANQPEVLVRLTRNFSSNVTVVGDVASSTRVPLTPSGERLLDALAAAGGVRQPVGKMTVQLTRGEQVQSLPLDTIIRDPKQNIPLVRGDVVTALFQPLSFIALGATGKNEEVSFETQGISLAQALARIGGLRDERSDPQGVFLFRFEQPNALNWPKTPVLTPDGKVPVIYRINLRDPASFFVAQNFDVGNKDVLYVSNAPVAELQKFLNVLFSIAYPLLNVVQVTK
ncbi:MAG: polysaccharide biosynthesis/export family protein [Burkholderiales bacterium]